MADMPGGMPPSGGQCPQGMPQNPAHGMGMGHGLDPHMGNMGVLLTTTHSQSTKKKKKKKESNT